MRKLAHSAAGLLAAGLLLLGTCGCGMELSLNPQELYSLPKLPAEYTELDSCIKSVLDQGYEYAAPTAGTHVQAVQLVDLDADGQEEAVAFFRNMEDEKPLKIYIFRKVEDGYQQCALIEGSGTSIYSMTYSDLDGDGWTELVIGWRAATDLQALSVYSLQNDQPVELLRTNYVRYAIADLDRDGLQELTVFRADDAGSGVADYYCWNEGQLLPGTPVRISMTMAELSQQGQVKKGTLKDETPALFVTGVEESSYAITDILIGEERELHNIVLSSATGLSTEVAAFRALYPMDINNDGVTEVPFPVDVEAWKNEEPMGYQRVDWRSYDVRGKNTTVMSTYHNVEDGWYFQLPDQWVGRITASRNLLPDESTVTFLEIDSRGNVGQPLLRISALTGSSRDIRAVRGKRFILNRQAETTFTAELLDANSAWNGSMTEDKVRAAFSLITREWDDN